MKNLTKQNTNSTQQKYSLVINLRSWTTPIVGLLMLVVGLLGGYFARPILTGVAQVPSVMASPDQGPPTEASTSISQAELPSSREELMDYLISETRHFKGNPDAQVTMIEFSDFQ